MSTTAEAPKVESTIILKNVRLAFPDLFQATQFEGTGKFSYKATLLVNPASPEFAAVNAAIQKAAVSKWAAKAQDVLRTVEGQSQKFAWIDGNKKDYDGFKGNWALATSRPQESGPPKVMDCNKSDLKASDGRVYGGCYVNAKVQIWAQDNQWGKAVRCTLIAIQRVKDGDAFGGTGPANDEGMEEVVDDASDLI